MQIKIKLFVFMMVIATATSCKNFDNSWDQARFHCGESVSETYRYIKITSSSSPVTEAVGFLNGQAQSLRILKDSCLEIPAGFTGQVFFRSATDSQILNMAAQPLLAFADAKGNKGLAKVSEQIQCLENAAYSTGTLDLNLLRQESDAYSFYLHELYIYDQNQKLVASQNINQIQLAIPLLNLGLQEGTYTAMIRSSDVFELAKGLVSHENSCQLVIDTTAPLVRSNLSEFDQLRSELFKLGAEQSMNFFVADENPANVRYCLEAFQGDPICSDSQEFKLVQDIVPAPQQGLWTLNYFAEDRAGNRSAIIKESFGVFHQQDIELVRKNFINSALYGLANRGQEGLRSYNFAIQAYDRLSLEEEKEELYWDLIGSLWRLEENVSLRYNIDLSGIDRIWADPYSDRVIAASGFGTGYLVEGQKIGSLDDSISDVGFGDDGDIALLKRDGEFVYFHKEKVIRIPTSVKRGNLRQLPDNRWLVFDGVGLFVIDPLLANAEEVFIRDHERRILSFGPSYTLSPDRRYLLFYNRNLIELIDLEDNPSFSASYSMKLAPPCGITNAFMNSDNDITIVSRFSVTLSQAGNDPACGIVRWNPREDLVYKYQYKTELGGDYTPENSFFTKREDSLSLVLHDRIASSYFFGIHRTSDEWDLQSGINWGRTEVGSSFNRLLGISQSLNGNYVLNRTDRELIVTPTPFPFLDQSPIFSLKVSSNAAEILAGRADIVVASQSKLSVHSLNNRIQGAMSLIDIENLENTDFYGDSQPLVARDSASKKGFHYDWFHQSLVFHDEYLRPTRTLAINAIPTSLAFFGQDAIWANRSGEIQLVKSNDKEAITISSGFDFVKQLVLGEGLDSLIVVDVDTDYQERVSFLKRNANSEYQVVYQSSRSSFLPTRLRLSPNKDSFLLARKVDSQHYETSIFNFDFVRLLSFTSQSDQTFYKHDGLMLISPENNRFVLRSLVDQSITEISLPEGVGLENLERIVANDHYIFYSNKKGVFRQSYTGEHDQLIELNDVIALNASLLLAKKDQNEIVIIDPTSLQQLTSTSMMDPIMSDRTTMQGDEIIVFGRDVEKRRFSVRRLSLNPESIRAAIQSWSESEE